jgi:alkanesulfonate monooxygenase SsuD/methylene tetrahydromethanopterin reductase-like flavin-dependent oxidoreductase (luciferase family)
VTRAQFDQEASVDGSLYVGSAETVAAKIARTVASLDIDRFDLKYSSGRLPHQKLMRNIELYGTQVVPKVREILAEESALLAG